MKIDHNKKQEMLKKINSIEVTNPEVIKAIQEKIDIIGNDKIVLK